MTVEMFVALGFGLFSFGNGDIRVGATPVSSLGDGFAHTLYLPVQGIIRSLCLNSQSSEISS